MDWDYYSFKNNKSVKQYATLVNDAHNKAKKLLVKDIDIKLAFSIPIYENIFTYNNLPHEAFPNPKEEQWINIYCGDQL